jgi:hypothetical protein
MTRRHPMLTAVLLSIILVTWGTAERICAQEEQGSAAREIVPSVLFIGNSFTYGGGSAVETYCSETVTDLNGTNIGGVPALFKMFTTEAGRNFMVSLETSPGVNLDYHLRNKRDTICQAWDFVLLQGYSVLDKDKPGDPTLLVRSARDLAVLLQSKNPNVDIRLVATWSRADQTYLESGHWYGQPIEKMALDVRKGYDLALAKGAPAIRGVIPVGEAWNRAMKDGLADPNPYDGITPGELDLWAKDHYHASAFGYYLYALMVFGDLTGLDPRSLGRTEIAASELGFLPEQTAALQEVAFEELTATKAHVPLRSFKAVKDSVLLDDR